ncbi:MAG: hypothetical protein LUC97_02935 [Clostridiales bacterium]|nr:hypothetical protein [Clostridiales bacterium]
MSDFNNALTMLKTGTVNSAGGMNQLITLTNNLSVSQLKTVLASQSLSTAQKTAILTSRGLSQAEAEAVLTSMGLTTAQNGATTSTVTLSNAFKGLWATLKANPLILVATAVTAVVSVYSALKQKAEEARQAALEAGEAAKTEAQNITDLYQAYSEAKAAYDSNTGSKEGLEEATDSLLSALGYEKSAIDELIDKYGSLDAAISNVTMDTIAEKRAELTQGYEAAKEQLVNDAKTGLLDAFTGDYMYTLSLGKSDEADIIRDVLKNAQIGYDGVYGSTMINDTDLLIGNMDSVEGIQKTYEYLLKARSALEAEIGNLYTREELSENTAYKNINDRLNTLKSSYEELEDYINNINSLSALEEVTRGLNENGIPETQEEFESLRDSIIEAAESSGEFVGSQEDIENAIDNTLAEFPELVSFTKDYAEISEQYDKAVNLFKNKAKEELESYNKDDTIDFAVRPVIDTSKLADVGWTDVGEGQATVFSSTYLDEDNQRAVVVTPILPNGDVLEPEALDYYANQLLAGEEIDVDIKMGMFEGEDYKDQAEEFANRIHELHEKYFVDDTNLDKFFSDNSIDSKEELDYWEEVTEGAETATEAIEMYNKAKAEAASELSFTDTVTQLDGLTKDFNAISTAYSNIQKNGKLDFSDITSLTENLGDLEGLETYIQNIQNATGNAEQMKIAVSDLTNAYIEQSGILDSLNEGNANLIASFLEEQGVTNATAVVQNRLALNMAETAAKTGDFTEATWNNIAAQLEECGALGNVGISVADLQTAYVTAQSAMSAAVSSGAMARLGILQSELEGIQTLAQAYAMLGGSRLASVGSAITDTSGNQRAMTSADIFQQTAITADEATFIGAAQAIIGAKDAINALKIDTNVGGAGGGGSSGGSGGGGGSGSGSSSTPKTNDNYYNYFEALIEDYKKGIEKYQDEIEKTDEKMEEALENNDYELYQELKAEREQKAQEYRDYLAKASADVRSKAEEEIYPIVYKYAPELEGTTIDEWSEQTLLDIQKRVDDEIVDMENSGADTAEIEAARKETEELMETLETAYDLVGNKNGEGEWAEAWAESAKEKFEQFQTEYDELLEYFERQLQEVSDEADSINNEISLIEAQGYEANDSLTRQLIENKEQENAILETQLEQLQAFIAEGISLGTLVEGSDQWYECMQDIADITNKIAENNIDIAGWTKELDEVDRHTSIFDRVLDRIKDTISKISILASSSFKSFTSKKGYITQEITAIKNAMGAVNGELEYLQEQLNSLGLSSEIMSAIKDGTIDALAIDDPDLSAAAQKALEYYEGILELQTESIDYAEQLASAYQDLFNNVSSKYESITNQLELNVSLIEQAISMTETQGYLTSSSYYEEMISLEEENIKQLKAQKSELESAFKTAVSSGGIEKGSDAWNEMQSSINDVTSAIWESEAAILEYEATIRELDWSNFDYLQETISEITEEADFLIDLLSYSDLYDDSGNITDEGLATLGLHGLNYNTYMEQAAKYAEELEEINEELADDEYNTDLLERRQELLEAQRDAILNAEEEKDAIKDLVEDGIDAELDALQELIDKYTDYLDEMEDLYEYQKDIADKTSDIASIRKQLAAYANDTSEETKAKIQQLEVDLAEAEEDLAETQYKQYISDMKKLLNNLYDEYEELLNSQLDDIDTLIENVISQVNSSSSDIMTTLETVSENVGYTLTDEMTSIWTPLTDETGEISDVLTTYSNNMAASMTTLQSTVENIVTKIDEMIEAADDLASSYISSANSDSEVTSTGSGSSSSSTTTTTASTDSSSSSSSSSSTISNSKAMSLFLQWLSDNKVTNPYMSKVYGNDKTAQSAIVKAYGNNHVGYVYYLLKSGGSYKVRRYSPGTGGSVVVSNGTIGAYASGTKYNPVAGNYLVDEEGAELIAHNNSGRITSLEVGDRVFNSGETANLADNLEAMTNSEWTNLEDTDFYKNYIDGIVSGLPYTTPVFNTPSISDIVPSYGDSVETKDSVIVYNYTVEDITLPNVQHADELYSEIMNMAKKDNKFTKLIQTVTASSLDSRKNSKAKNNIQF